MAMIIDTGGGFSDGGDTSGMPGSESSGGMNWDNAFEFAGTAVDFLGRLIGRKRQADQPGIQPGGTNQNYLVWGAFGLVILIVVIVLATRKK